MAWVHDVQSDIEACTRRHIWTFAPLTSKVALAPSSVTASLRHPSSVGSHPSSSSRVTICLRLSAARARSAAAIRPLRSMSSGESATIPARSESTPAPGWGTPAPPSTASTSRRLYMLQVPWPALFSARTRKRNCPSSSHTLACGAAPTYTILKRSSTAGSASEGGASPGGDRIACSSYKCTKHASAPVQYLARGEGCAHTASLSVHSMTISSGGVP
eukprot:1178712-Prorocentrum_minimum.AAC.3